MKKIAVCILVAVLLCACSVNVCASSDLNTLGLRISAPDKYDVIMLQIGGSDFGVPNGLERAEGDVNVISADEMQEEEGEGDAELKPIDRLILFLPSIIIFFGPAVAGIIIAIVMKKRKEKQAATIAEPQDGFCSRCGQSLVAGTQFCNRCGSRVNSVSKLYPVQPMQLSANFTDDFGWRAELAALKSDEIYRRYCDAEEWSKDYRALCYQELVKRQETTSQS